MSEVSTYPVESKLRTFEYRLETLEQARKDEIERLGRRNKLMLHLMLFIPVLVAAVLWSVVLTLDAAGN